MAFDATFWVAVSFIIFFGALVYMKIPQKIIELLDKMIGGDSIVATANVVPDTTVYVPLQFWFCRNPGLALPLIALHLSDIKIHIELKKLEDIIIENPTHYINIDENIVHFNNGDILTLELDSQIQIKFFETKLWITSFG